MLIDLPFIREHVLEITFLVSAIVVVNTLINAGILKALGSSGIHFYRKR
jgi:hypothetical protein